MFSLSSHHVFVFTSPFPYLLTLLLFFQFFFISVRFDCCHHSSCECLFLGVFSLTSLLHLCRLLSITTPLVFRAYHRPCTCESPLTSLLYFIPSSPFKYLAVPFFLHRLWVESWQFLWLLDLHSILLEVSLSLFESASFLSEVQRTPFHWSWIVPSVIRVCVLRSEVQRTTISASWLFAFYLSFRWFEPTSSGTEAQHIINCASQTAVRVWGKIQVFIIKLMNAYPTKKKIGRLSSVLAWDLLHLIPAHHQLC